MGPQTRERLLCLGRGTTALSCHVQVLLLQARSFPLPDLIEERPGDASKIHRRFSLPLVPSRRRRDQGTAPVPPDGGAQNEESDQSQRRYSVDTDPEGKGGVERLVAQEDDEACHLVVESV